MPAPDENDRKMTAAAETAPDELVNHHEWDTPITRGQFNKERERHDIFTMLVFVSMDRISRSNEPCAILSPPSLHHAGYVLSIRNVGRLLKLVSF